MDVSVQVEQKTDNCNLLALLRICAQNLDEDRDNKPQQCKAPMSKGTGFELQ